MKLSLTLTLFLFILNFSSLAYEVEGRLKNLSPDKIILEGESFDGELSIWPMPEESLEAIKESLEGKSFLDYFYIAKIDNIRFSENNSDVIVVNAKVVLVKAYESKSVFIWTYKSLTVPVAVEEVAPQKNDVGKNFVILNQKEGFLSSKYNFSLLLVGLLFIVLTFYFGRKVQTRRRIKKEQLAIISNWNNLFQNAKRRADVEIIYAKKSEWLNIIGGETPPIINFFETLNAIQYKQSWNDIEEHKVLEAFDDIRGIFART
ncbi:hypothetical protein [Halobacteriovorax sp. JY17]|uniref:hypothetical protein n=1 Tax=Halobacteriovorax sp. JY17 TaxID=2014617 RepID=UPI000C3FEE3C|nr:hypothetical protein [Halobacteriovorax sp. JY17]PIK14463.1 MAG: hypothetical protein CES88_08960 [Halobacteriovorax sp. JY17]